MADFKKFLSKYGKGADLKMHQKKGLTIVEKSTAEEAAGAVQKPDGTIYKDREVGINLEKKEGRTGSASVKRHKERGERHSGDRERENSAGRTGHVKNRDSVKRGSEDKERDRNAVSSHGKYKGEYSERFKKMSASMADSRSKSGDSDSGDRQAGRSRREKPEKHGRDRKPTERPSGSDRTGKKEWTSGQPLHSDGPKLGEERENYNNREKTGIFHRPKERPADDGERGNRKREWRNEKSSGASGRPGNRRDDRPGRNQPREERSGSHPNSRSSSGSPKQSARSSRPKTGESGRGRSSNSSRPDTRGGAGGRDRNNRSKRD